MITYPLPVLFVHPNDCKNRKVYQSARVAFKPIWVMDN